MMDGRRTTKGGSQEKHVGELLSEVIATSGQNDFKPSGFPDKGEWISRVAKNGLLKVHAARSYHWISPPRPSRRTI